MGVGEPEDRRFGSPERMDEIRPGENKPDMTVAAEGAEEEHGAGADVDLLPLI
jgi:hypothetical protein